MFAVVKKPLRLFDRLSIQSKLFLMLLIASILSIIVTGYVGYSSGRAALRESRLSELTNLRTSKAGEIQSYLDGVTDQVQFLGENQFLIRNAKAIRAAFTKIDQTAITKPTWAVQRLTYYENQFIPRLSQNIDGTPTLETYLPQGKAAKYLQHHYVVNNTNVIGEKDKLDQAKDDTEYSKVHAQLQPAVRNIVDKFHYYDIFLIDPETRDIVYSYEKEVDFATNLKSGPYADSNLAKAVEAVLKSPDKQYIKIVDYEHYRPSYGSPAAFIATPLLENSKLVGVLAVQISADDIDRVMTNNRQWAQTGLGQTGEAILVGSDYQMRSNSRFFLEDPKKYFEQLKRNGASKRSINRLRSHDTTILNQSIQTDVVESALKNKTGILDNVKDYRNVPSIVSFAPIKFGDVNWAIVARMDESEAFAPINEFRKRIVITASGIILLITLIATSLARLFVNPIYSIINAARSIVAGRLDTTIQVKSRDELYELAKTVNQMTDKLRQQKAHMAEQNTENKRLLKTLLPGPIVPRYQAGENPIADKANNVSVIIAEIAGFNRLSMEWPADSSVSYLNELFCSFDQATMNQGVERIKTSGTAYLAVSGLMIPRLDHSKYALEYALILQKLVDQFNQTHGMDLRLRIGIDAGPVIAGVVGDTRFSYNLWGSTVIQTRVIASHTVPDEIWVGQALHDRLGELYTFEARPAINIEGRNSTIPVWSVKRG
ncbi:HAMP domain-containing protein [filamentous cyanobacterium LEGE 11480]|uniref:HAMP domain-containing protein n=1 Tax=Romeriopsis navalis LEGE 11480 TaxID=2777977 RepID=A0A928VTL8_9CYAN|nr:adenylate/guanylate cyclase domain-containing protein [Romeriopsis navalis]MBE9032009.1 HAMP domain-containing protein [Romeriopsis navalis LEGE 11480]